jgi:hypothetical protein
LTVKTLTGMTTDVYPRENCKLRVLNYTLQEKKRTFAVELKAGVGTQKYDLSS